MTDIGPEDGRQIELHDSELKDATELLIDLQRKYAHKQGTFENLRSLQQEAEERFAGIGLEVIVDWISSGLSITPHPPIIQIIGRTTDFDIDRQKFDVQKGVAEDHWKRKRG